jgi:hypothetical protein
MTNSCPVIDSPTPGLTPLKRESSRTKTGGQIPTYVAFAPKNGMSILVDQCSEISKLEAMYFLSQAIRHYKWIAVPPRATGHVFNELHARAGPAVLRFAYAEKSDAGCLCIRLRETTQFLLAFQIGVGGSSRVHQPP